jgi:hypothetical protein
VRYISAHAGSLATVTADEFYFRTTHAHGGSLILDAMVEEALTKRYDFAAVRCVPGDDGMFYWCIVFCRDERMDRLAIRDTPSGTSPGMSLRMPGDVNDATSALGPPGTRPVRTSCGMA